MKRKTVSIIICLAMVATLFVGCGKSTDETNVTNEGKETNQTTETQDNDVVQTEDDPVTISYACWDSNQARLLETMVVEFEEANPDIKIEIQVNGWSDYWTALEAAGTGGSLPDTFWMHSNNIYYYGANDQLLDLTQYIEKSQIVDLVNYPEGLNEIYNIEGNQYAIPKDFDTIALWYNKVLFDEAGLEYPDDTWTWSDLKEAAKILTKEDGSQYGMCAGLHNQEGYYNFVYQAGGEIVTENNESGYDLENTILGIEQYFSFVHEGLSPEIYDDAARAEAIQNGLCAMGLFGSWNLSGFADSDLMKEDFDCAVLPMSDDGGKASIFNGLGNAIAATCENPDEAWRWVEYLSSKEGQEKQADLGIAISAYNGTANKFANAYPMFNTKCYIDMVVYSQIRPYTNMTSVWEDKAYELLKNAYAGKESVGDACKAVADMMNTAISSE